VAAKSAREEAARARQRWVRDWCMCVTSP
jgi:hypothetical protein